MSSIDINSNVGSTEYVVEIVVSHPEGERWAHFGAALAPLLTYEAAVERAMQQVALGWTVRITERTTLMSPGTALAVFAQRKAEADAPAVVNADGTPTSYTVAMLTGVPQHRRAATPAERWAHRIPETCVADKHGDCITHYHVVQP
jgi:hypothetical protein